MCPEELSWAEPSFKGDIFCLGCVIYYILSNGSHPFGQIKNPTIIISNIKNMPFHCDVKSFLTGRSVKPSYKSYCASMLLENTLVKNPDERSSCTEMIKNPLFWTDYEIYGFFHRIGSSWIKLPQPEQEKIDEEILDMNDKNGNKLFDVVTKIAQKV